MLSSFPVWLLLLLVPLVLTVLAWIKGLRAIAVVSESTAGVRARTLPPMLFLVGPVVILLSFVGMLIAHVAPLMTAPWQLVLIGAVSSVAALVTSAWSPRGFRALALFAAAAWVACFGLALAVLSALHGLQ
jgi:hypothetical protein